MSNKIVVVKYNAGNIQSVLYALERIGAEATVTDNAEKIRQADRVIFPGVGEASSAMQYLKNKGLDEVIKKLTQPVLGICLGMQLMCSHSEENDTDCLAIFNERIIRFTPAHFTMAKVPQVGWNKIYSLSSPLFNNVDELSYCYFVHSYYAGLGSDTIGITDYVQPYSSALNKNNFYGVQFHPEKSANVGEKILKNFITAHL